MNKNVLIPVGLVAALLVVGAIVVLQRNSAGPTPIAPTGQNKQAAPAPLSGGPITITMTEWKYNPPVVKVQTGQKVKLEAKNAGLVMHSLACWQLAIDTGFVKPGETRAYEFTAPGSPGVFECHSTVPGQQAQGMSMSIAVEGKDLNAVAPPAIGPDGKPVAPLPLAPVAPAPAKTPPQPAK